MLGEPEEEEEPKQTLSGPGPGTSFTLNLPGWPGKGRQGVAPWREGFLGRGEAQALLPFDASSPLARCVPWLSWAVGGHFPCGI